MSGIIDFRTREVRKVAAKRKFVSDEEISNFVEKEPRLLRFLTRLDGEQLQVVEIITAAIIRGAL